MKQIADVSDVIGKVTPPPELGDKLINAPSGAAAISIVLGNLVTLIYTVAAVVFIFMIVFSAFQWLSSGGEKEKVAAARQRLTYAIIGIVLLSLSFVIIQLIGTITGFTLFQNNLPPGDLDRLPISDPNVGR